MSTSPLSQSAEVFDGRELPCEVKRPAFLARCVALPLGHSFVFLNGHDPVPLRQHLDQLYPDCFRWAVQSGAPDAVRLHVTKTGEPAGGFTTAAAAIACH